MSNSIKRGILLTAAFLLFAAGLTYARDNGLKVIHSGQDYLEIEYIPQIKSFDTLSMHGGTPVIHPHIEGTIPLPGETGEPYTFALTENITVPGKEKFDLAYTSVVQSELIEALPPAVADKHNDPMADFSTEPDMDKYIMADAKADPHKWVKLDYRGIAGNRHIASITINAAIYDSEKQGIAIPDTIRFRIDFTPDSKRAAADSRRPGPVLTLNHVETSSWMVSRNSEKVKGAKNNGASLLNNKGWAQITLADEGIYRITATDLKEKNINISTEDISTIKIYGTGGDILSEKVPEDANATIKEQAIEVIEKSDGSLDYIIFYGSASNGFYKDEKGEISHFLNPYSDKNYYLLTWGGEPGKRLQEKPMPAGPVVNNPRSYMHRMFEEEELMNPYFWGSGRQWVGRSYFSSAFVNKLHDLDRSGQISYNFSVAHRSEEGNYFSIYENGNQISSIYLNSTKSKYTHLARNNSRVTLAAADISSDNRSVLKFEYAGGQSGTASTGYLDYYEIAYPRPFKALEDQLEFFNDNNISGITEYSISGFNGNPIIGLDVTDRNYPMKLKNISVTGGIYKFREDHSTEQRRFLISSKLRKPEIEKITYPYLRESVRDADYIVITHPDLMESALEYADYRRSNSDLSIEVISIKDIYTEFGCGKPDIMSIRNFIAYAYQNWNVQPSYVMIWGDGHYDFKGIQVKEKNFIPTYQDEDDVTTFSEIDSYSSDDHFVMVNGDDRIIDLAIGRVNIQSNHGGRIFIEKLKHYENNSAYDLWRTYVTLVADDGYSGKEDYEYARYSNQSEELAADYISDDFQQEKVYLAEYPLENIPGGTRKPACKQALLTNINTKGALILNWIGHGNPRVWSHEEIFDRDKDIKDFRNYDKLFFLVAATCDFGRFDNGGTQSGAEELLLSDIGGAIAVFSATRVVYGSSNLLLSKSLYTEMFTRNPTTGRYCRLGDIIYKTKLKHFDSNSIKFNLMGDPTLRLLMPEYRIRIDSINGIAMDSLSEPLHLQALSKVTIEATIINQKTNKRESGFEGNALITARDGLAHKLVYDERNTAFHFTELGGALNKSAFIVENGKFTGEFVIPKDISFSDKQGILFAYAYSDDKTKFAQGSQSNFIINGVDITAISDDQGPEIKIFLDSRSFDMGDHVSKNPKLIVDISDETGINATGLGIGHRIEAWIDDSPESKDLTDKFTTSLTDNRSGYVEDILYDLEPGQHKVKVRAWDVYNNYSVEETYFLIADNGRGVVQGFRIHPNPFTPPEETMINFKHNLTPPFDVDLKVFTSGGKLVKSINTRLSTANTAEIPWDGTDSDGSPLPQGAYLFSITADDGTKVETYTVPSMGIIIK
ncbi:MAG: type IX secretion system sortase PorU [Candidatus Kapaibacterium sp.]